MAIEAARRTGHVFQVNVSSGGVPKRAVPRATVTAEGLADDAHNDTKNHGGSRPRALSPQPGALPVAPSRGPSGLPRLARRERRHRRHRLRHPAARRPPPARRLGSDRVDAIHHALYQDSGVVAEGSLRADPGEDPSGRSRHAKRPPRSQHAPRRPRPPPAASAILPSCCLAPLTACGILPPVLRGWFTSHEPSAVREEPEL